MLVQVALLFNIILLITVLFMVLYGYYKIDQLHTELKTQTQDVYVKFSKLVAAINAVNYSEVQVDIDQQEQIDQITYQ